MKSCSRVPTASTTSASAARWLAEFEPRPPIGPAFIGWSWTSTVRPAMVSTTGTRCRVGELGQRRLGPAVAHAAAGDQQRLLGRAQQRRRLLELPHVRRAAAGCGGRAGSKNRAGIVERLGLHVLAQAEEGRPAVGRVEQDAQRLGQGLEQLLGPGDPVPVAGHRLEGVVDADASGSPQCSTCCSTGSGRRET